MRANNKAVWNGAECLGAVSLATVSLMAMLAGSTTAMAQESPSAAVDDDSSIIVVTAQRRAELSRDVPISLTTADAQDLKQANVESITSLPKLVASLRVDQQGAYAQPTIRGIGTTLVQTAVGASVGTYVDGFYLPNPLALDFPFLSISNVQVLKGPQGTLFGRNTTGGAILISTLEPSFETSAIAEVGYERFDAVKAQAYVTTPINQKIAVSLEGQWAKGDGYVRNIYDGSLATGGGFGPGANVRKPGAYEKWSIRAGVLAELSDSASLLVRYEHLDNNDPTGNVGNVYTRGGVAYSRADAIPGALIATGRRDSSANIASIFRFRSDAIQVTGKFDLGFADLTSYTQYREEQIENQSDNDRSAATITALNLPERDRIMSQELLLNSQPGSRFQYTGGIFLFEHKVDAIVGLGQGVSRFAPASATGAIIRTYAGFFDGTYELANNLFVTGGLRYSRDEVKRPYYQTTFNVPGVFTYQSDRSDSKLTPRVVIRYKPTDETSLYASFSKGHKAAVPDYRSTSGGEYLEPENITAYEAGFKYGARRLTAEFAAFHYDYKNLQNGFYLIGATVLSNAASARVRGVEGSLKYQLFEGFELSANGAYVDAKYRDYRTAGYFTPVFIPDNDGDGRPEFNGFITTQTADASGNQMQRSPKLSGAVSARYTTQVADGELVASANLYHSSRVYFDAGNQFSQPAYDVVSARLQWTDPSDRYTLAVYGDNLLDQTYLRQVVITPTGVVAGWAKPRSYGVSLRAKW